MRHGARLGLSHTTEKINTRNDHIIGSQGSKGGIAGLSQRLVYLGSGFLSFLLKIKGWHKV
jgi:hypothetical protein